MKKTLFAVLMALFVSDLAMASKANVKQDYLTGKNPLYNRQDGVYIDKTDKGAVLVQNNWVDRPLSRSYYVEDFVDFLGLTTLPSIVVGGSTSTIVNELDSPWWVKDTSSGGSPSYAKVANADNGQYQITLANTDEAETVTLFWGDSVDIDTDLGPVVQFKLQLAVWAAATGNEIVFGLASAQNDTLNSVANNAWFYLKNELNLYVESDDGTTDDDDNDTSVDLVAATWYDFMVDCSNPLDCDFFYRASGVGTWTELLSTTAFSIGEDAAVQPFLQIMKSGTGTDTSVPSVIVDSIQTYWKRQ